MGKYEKAQYFVQSSPMQLQQRTSPKLMTEQSQIPVEGEVNTPRNTGGKQKYQDVVGPHEIKLIGMDAENNEDKTEESPANRIDEMSVQKEKVY